MLQELIQKEEEQNEIEFDRANFNERTGQFENEDPGKYFYLLEVMNHIIWINFPTWFDDNIEEKRI